MKPVVAIVGRPNVGKSSLFNRIVKSKNAIVDDSPGVTRDRNYGDASWDDTQFTLIDTGGFIKGDDNGFARQIRFQVDQAIEDADSIILVLDGKEGISPFDADLVKTLRTSAKQVFYAVNKIDGIEQEKNLSEFYSLGIEKLHPVSAEHGYGIRDFLDDLVFSLPKSISEPSAGIIKIAVIGRPNVGKSSLINFILGEDRLLVSNIPGTTRDTIDSVCDIDGKSYLFIDTAGIRRKGRVSKKLEKFSIIKALKSLDRCDVALILVDACEGITQQDITVAGYAYERGCGCIMLLNKWDIVEKEKKSVNKYYDQLKIEAKFLSFAPVLTISAKTGLRVSKIFSLIQQVQSQYSKRLGTGRLNKILKQAVEKNEPSLHRGKRIKFYYATQVSAKPPTFVIFVNYPDAVHFSYKRYLINQIREKASLDKTPIRIIFRLRTGRIEFTTPKGQRRKNKGS
ncbi:MAG: ribosome biogenesis GTPase Der [Deltaproteobacteria bacterium]|nr:MAG: ribosome biogenesis GTPase Der [Deltaproteobacteria bacterium]